MAKYELETARQGKVDRRAFEASDDKVAVQAARIAIGDQQNLYQDTSGRLVDEQGRELFSLEALKL